MMLDLVPLVQSKNFDSIIGTIYIAESLINDGGILRPGKMSAKRLLKGHINKVALIVLQQ